MGPWIGATAYILVYGVVMGVRFERGRWRQIKLVSEDRPEIAVHIPLGPAAPALDAASSYRDMADDLIGQPPRDTDAGKQ